MRLNCHSSCSRSESLAALRLSNPVSVRSSPENEEAAATDWRHGANYYFFTNAGLGVQYKFCRYSYDRRIVPQKLGGEITHKGVQVYLSFRF